ncbi:FGGY family carbohydrate kinase [Nocardioides sp. GY 10127]|uniref:FGGY family carbohydrate kinase n=1 Tax=Nocardioides sp. GY 10127 TaxID=2569762 RepID=UPI001F105D71|nr:FGGY family carbohydrate kinase [Nocardioides sp. GY 10127]
MGVDTSTQSTKSLLVDAETGEVLESAAAPHPVGTEVDPRAWTAAFDSSGAALLPRAEAVSVAGQQHGMVALDSAGEPVRDALLWNDTRSAQAALDLIEEMGGPAACAEVTGSVMVASITASKLRWMRDHEPENAARTASVLLPHDYLSAHLAAPGTEPFTDAGDASGTGYFATALGEWRPDLAANALGHEVALPRIAGPGAVAARTAAGQVVGAGTGDNAGAALGLALRPGDVLLSVGTSGVASTVSAAPLADPTGTVTGFADAQGGFLPMVTTINAARILDLQAAWLGVDVHGLADLALSSAPGAGGVTLSPYYGGERSPNRPDAVGTWTGLRSTTTRADLARAAFEALACSLADAAEQLQALTGQEAGRVLLVGGATRSPALQQILPAVLGRPVELPPPGEYVARGAARQAAWALSGAATPPDWPMPGLKVLDAAPTPGVREAYLELKEATATWA